MGEFTGLDFGSNLSREVSEAYERFWSKNQLTTVWENGEGPNPSREADVRGLEMPNENSLDIDNQDDFDRVAQIYKKHSKN